MRSQLSSKEREQQPPMGDELANYCIELGRETVYRRIIHSCLLGTRVRNK
jgi:hypothetical protein